MEVVRADGFGESVKTNLSEIFVEGFYEWLKFFSKDKSKLVKAFSHMFNLSKFYVCITDKEVAGIAAITDGKDAVIKLNKKELKKNLGFFKGFLAYTFLKRELVNHTYPFKLDEATGSIEFVAVRGKWRGLGVATRLIQEIIINSNYNNYVLEVADSNTPAVNLYYKLGFSEILKVPCKHAKSAGFNNYLYLKYSK